MEKSFQYSFLNNLNGFTLSLIKGKYLIKDIEKIHNIGPHAREFYQKTILSSLQMVNFLKPTESLGFYIDSESPYYRFKVEMSAEGSMRTLLLPEDFSDFPTHFSGKCRVHKTIRGKSPYTSVLEFENEQLDEIINQVMEQSYQTQSRIIMSADNESSLMITLLPPTNIDSTYEELEPLEIPKIRTKYRDIFHELLNLDLSTKELENKLEPAGFNFIGSKQVKFHCPCSKDRMIENLLTLGDEDREHIFKENNPVEIRCDYCNTIYQIGDTDLDVSYQ